MNIKIYEVGPRDGLQNQSKSIDIGQKQKFIELLVEAGHRHIEAGAFVHAVKIPQMAGSVELFRNLKMKDYFWALVPNARGFESALESSVKNIAVFTAASETFNQRNINASITESFERFEEFIPKARKLKLGLRGYISTCFGCPYEGKVNPKAVLAVTEKLLRMGIKEISIGDTIGVATPLEVKKLVRQLSKIVSLKKIALHFHDTRGTALANILAGLEVGIKTFDSSAGGLGGCPYAPGAAGNVATDDLIYMLHGMGLKTGIDLSLQLKASLYIQECLGQTLPSRVLQAGLPKIFT